MNFQDTNRSVFFGTSAASRQGVIDDRRAAVSFADRSQFDGRRELPGRPVQNDDAAPVSVNARAAQTDRGAAEGASAAFEELFAPDHFEFPSEIERAGSVATGRDTAEPTGAGDPSAVLNATGDGRPGPDPDPTPLQDADPDPAPPPLDPPQPAAEPTVFGRPAGTEPGAPQVTPPAPAPGADNAEYGRPADAVPDPGIIPLTTYISGGPASSSYNVTIEFEGTWSIELQAAFIDAADYLSTIILGDLPDAIVDGIIIDDLSITATLEPIDGPSGTLGSAGPRDIRTDGSLLPATGAMRFDIADAPNQLALGNWETIILHEMMHAMGFGTLWSAMGLTTGSIAGGDLRFTGANATDTYQSEFAGIAGADPGSLLGVPVETDGGSGTAGSHWDEDLFNAEIMTGYVDAGGFVSVMTIAALEDMGYDTVFDNPYSATDQSGPIPVDPLMDLFA